MKTRFLLLLAVVIGLFVVGPAVQPQLEARQPREIKDLTQALTHASSPEPEECIRGLNAITTFAPAKRNALVVDVLKGALRNSNVEVRIAACRTVGELMRVAPEYQNVCSFAELLDSSEPAVRLAALENLAPPGGMYTSDEVEALIRLLKDKDPTIRFRAYGHLGTAGAVACLVQSGDRAMPAAATIIENLETESAEEDPATKLNLLSAAVRALGKVGRRSPKAVPTLIKLYARFPADTKRDTDLRDVVIGALAEIGPFSDKSLPFLTKLLRDEKLPLRDRASAAWAIGRFGSLATDLVPEMIALHRLQLKQLDPPRGTGSGIIGAFAWLGETAEPAVPHLLELAQGEEQLETTEYAIRALGSLGPVAAKQAAPVLGKLYFAERDHKESQRLRFALAKFKEHGARVALDALKGNDLVQQCKAILVLQEMGPYAQPALPELKQIAADNKHKAHTWAKSALEKLDRWAR